MNTVLLKSDYEQALKRVKRRALKLHLIGILITALALTVPYVFKLERDVAVQAYQVAKGEFENVLMKHELLVMLRTRPMTAGQALDLVDVVMNQREVPVSIVLGVIAQESSFRPEAISNKGARGLMQLLPATFTGYSSNPLLKGARQIHDPILNVKAGISYLADLQATYSDWRKTLRAYYAGPTQANNRAYDGYVDGVMNKAARYER